MTTVRVTGPATTFDFRSEDTMADDAPVVSDPRLIQTLDGLEHDEIFSDYFSDGGDTTLADAGISGGRLRFEFDRESRMLFCVTEYSSPRPLTDSELELLRDYTIGQWSDGIGENFFQERMDFGLAPMFTEMDDPVVTIRQSS